MSFRTTHLAPLLSVFSLWACDGPSLPPGDGDDAGGAPSGSGGSSSGHEDDLLVDDFEDGDATTALGTPWSAYSDSSDGGASEYRGADGATSWIGSEGHESAHALSVEFTHTKADYAWDPFVGFVAPLPSGSDFSEMQGFSYWHRGAAHSMRVELSSVSDYDFHGIAVPAAAEWTLVEIPFESLRQDGFGTPVAWDASLVRALTWHVVAPDGTEGRLELDDVWVEKTLEIERGEPDWIVREPSPPAEVDIESIEIPGALQEKAMAHLNRGYNLTNWLEAGRFESYQFDESYVEKLAAAGFLGLRLPLDLDLYVTGSSGSGDELELELHPDLFDVLDDFDAWTTEHGLSFTIDYHQYDSSLDLDDAASVDEAVALWRAVAAHFAESPRDDLYFELLNEPELSVGASAPISAASWTSAATRMLEAIRAEDTTHTILFGDVNWYGIDQLAARTPFDDDNVVYVFHFYEPFIFTHQGASWANMTTTREIPYPYSPERWSDYAADLGLTSAQPTWIWDQFRNYHVQGTRAALWNRIVRAKQWGVEHGVPVTTNEFGVYERAALREDCVRYYTDLIDIFEELEIPWQVWFMILEEDGTVREDYRSAFRLDE